MIDILYEDEFYFIINKPAGKLVIPAPGKSDNLTSDIDKYLELKGLQYRAHPCHRLDGDTSGAIIFAKGKSSQKLMMELFRKHEVQKRYIAVVNGLLRKKNDEIRYRIEGKEALTVYSLIKSSPKCSLVEINLLTGRTNQIRIHFKMIGHSLIGDTKFEIRKNLLVKFKRTALHSSFIGFTHPYTGQAITVTAQIPDDMGKLISSELGLAEFKA